MKRGTLVLALLPFTDLTGQKRRPALVLSPEDRPGDDILVAFITSYRGEPLLATDLLLTAIDPDFKRTGLKRASVIKLDKLFTIQKGLVVGKLGDFSPLLMAKVDQRLRLALGLP